MNKFTALTALALILGLSGEALAQGGFSQQAAGGYTGPAAPVVTVAEAQKLGDDTPVVMTGKIEKNLGGEKYLFTDKTGSITIEIDNEDWKGISVNEKDTVEIRGEIDKDFTNREVDVDTIIKK